MKRILHLIIFIIFFSSFSSGQISNQSIMHFQKKIALVVGNGNYKLSTLANPENDARAMKSALQNVGFTVFEYENLNQNQMKKAIDDFGDTLKNNDVGLFYYAGHGIQAKGYNYLIPVDAELKSEGQVEYDCVQADRVLALMEASGTKVNIIIMDACRNNPFERSWTRTATGRGLAFMNAPSGTLIAYATSPGSTASDGSGKNGLYTYAILESIQMPNITITQMFQNVGNIVSQKSGKKQIPWISSSLTGDFFFRLEDSLGLSKNGKTQFSLNNSDQLVKTVSSNENNLYSSLQRNYEWSLYSLNTQVKSYIEKTFSIENKFGTWTPINQLKQSEITFNEKGLISEISISDSNSILSWEGSVIQNKNQNLRSRMKFIGKYLYQSQDSSIKIVEYDSKGKTKRSLRILFPNDTTVIDNGDKITMQNQKLFKTVSLTDTKKAKYWIYSKEGLISSIEEVGTKRTEKVISYEYLEYDQNGNWTKRLDYGLLADPKFITTREYKY